MLSSSEPVVSVPPVVLAGEFVLRHDLAVAAVVQWNIRVLGPPESSNIEEVEAVLVLGVDDVEEVVEEDEDKDKAAAVGVEYEPMSEEDVVEHYDSDNSEDDVGMVSVRESKKRLVAPPAESVVPDRESHGPPRFAVVGNTAGFMRITTTVEAVGTRDHNHNAIDQIG
jgi:hypothetical protein